MTTPNPDTLWRLAQAQWAEIIADLPDLAGAVALQQRLLRLMIDEASALDVTWPGSLTPEAIVEKWRRGLPALRNTTVPIPSRLKRILPPLCTALADGGAGESALHIRNAIEAQQIDGDSLLSVSLARNQKAIRTSALHMGFSPDLVWLIGELGSAPLANRLGSDPRTSTAFDETRDLGVISAVRARSTELGSDPRTGTGVRPQEWDRGYCPFCGSWPTFIEALEGGRTLRCSYCALGWSLSSNRCIYCGNAGEDFIIAAPDVNKPERRVELCGRCSGYTKVINVREPAPFPLLAIADLATMTLDQGAMSRGYRRPELFDLDTIEPRAQC